MDGDYSGDEEFVAKPLRYKPLDSDRSISPTLAARRRALIPFKRSIIQGRKPSQEEPVNLYKQNREDREVRNYQLIVSKKQLLNDKISAFTTCK